VQLIQNINVAKMIDFTLTPEQQAYRSFIRSFANTHLKNARLLYDPPTPHTKWSSRFHSTQPIYRAAVEAGLIKAQIPAVLGGTGGSLGDAAIVVEELYSVETSASLTLLGTGLGLTPLIMAGSLEQHKKFLPPFLSGEGTPLGSLVFSEPAGSANFAEAGVAGFSTTACEDGDDYVINGEKVTCPSSNPTFVSADNPDLGHRLRRLE
jgi:nitroalkane oxidase